MHASQPPRPEERVLILAPLGQDGSAMAELLKAQGFLTQICGDPGDCSQRIQEGAGVLVLAEEALEMPRTSGLLETLKAQPAWSELPLILLTRGGESRLARLLDLAASAAGSVTFLERPMRAATLWRSVEVALRSRRRQYQVRDLIEEQRQRQQKLAEQARLLDLSYDAILVRDAQDRVTYWNKGAEEIYGYSREEALGQVSHRLLRTEAPEALEQIKQRLLHEGRWSGELVHICKNGSRIIVASRWMLDRDPEGRPHEGSVLETNNDITQRKSAGEAKSRLAAIVEFSDDAIISKDLNSIITSWNRGAERLFGYAAEEAIGRSITMLMPEDRVDEEPGILERIRRGEPIEHYETVRRRKDGTLLDISLTVSPLYNDRRQIIGASKIARDITEQKRIERTLRAGEERYRTLAEHLERTVAERTADLREINEQLEAFVYSIAHDLRAPVRSMMVYSQILMEDHAPALDDAGQQMLKRIQASSEFMDKLLVDLLAYGRTARSGLEISPVELEKAWESALLQCALQIEQSNARIETIRPLPAVLGHEGTLAQVLANLLNNALKFVSPGVQPRVRFWTEESAAKVRLWIEDNGIGIPADQHERIFRVFERLHGARYTGTGIGLSIVRKGIERMHGQLGLESSPGQGTRFWIDLRKPQAA